MGLLPLLLAALAIFTSASGTSAAPNEGIPSPGEIMRQVEKDGAHVVVFRLWDDSPEVFGKICDRIASGDREWLEVARLLRSGSDAAVTLSLDYSVAQAIPVAPVDTLRLINRGFPIAMICTTPFIEPDPGVAERYQQRAIESLSKPVPPDLEQVRTECLERIRKSLGPVPSPHQGARDLN